MGYVSKSWKSLTFLAVGLSLLPAVTKAQHYTQTNLVSDQTGVAAFTDPNLVNPWGLTRSPTTTAKAGSPWWVSDNNSGFSTLYTGTGAIIPINGTGTVTIPPPKGSPAGTVAAPTGIVYNGSPTDFLVTPGGTAAAFIFVTEDGTISAWAGGTAATLEVDNSDGGSPRGAVYKGATSGVVNGKTFLYVTNFRSGRVEVYDNTFTRVRISEELFDDDAIPRDFAPFNIQNIGGTLFVTYAKQDAAKHDDVAGEGNGFVELYQPNGFHIGHLQHGPWLNSPWGVVWTPRDFGVFSNSILVGNFGSGCLQRLHEGVHRLREESGQLDSDHRRTLVAHLRQQRQRRFVHHAVLLGRPGSRNAWPFWHAHAGGHRTDRICRIAFELFV